jgi:hypothetical protein
MSSSWNEEIRDKNLKQIEFFSRQKNKKLVGMTSKLLSFGVCY